MRRVLALAAGLASAGAPAAALAQTTMSEVVVVAPAPLRGAGIDADKLAGTVDSLGAADFAREGSLSVSDALSQRTPGANLSDSQGNPFAESFESRGFQASPLQGTPEGLAVYMDGIRLNETFGDTVNWDLIPETAVARADLFTSNPTFGLNALGGAVNLTMKTGYDSPGGGVRVEGGSFGRAFGSAEYGAVSGPWALYVAADGGHEAGWRLQSPSSVARVYGDLGWKQDRAEVHVIVSAGRTLLGVVGPTPVDLLNANRAAVFTYPQATRNETALIAVNGRYDLGRSWSVQANTYARGFDQRHVDGNAGDLQGCSGDPRDPLFGTLCVDDSGFPAATRPPAAAFQIRGPDGAAIGCPQLLAGQTTPCDGVPYGTVDRTRTRSSTFGLALQATNDAMLFGRANLFTTGASFDQGRADFSANSTLGVIQPDLSVATDAAVPGAGEVIHAAGDIAYSPIAVRTTTRYGGLYASDTFDLLPSLSATVSGRLNLADVALKDLSGASAALDGAHSFARFNPAAGLAWRFAPDVSLYGGYAEANRVPTALELGCSDALRPCLLENALVADPPLRQVVARSWEGGLRGRDRLAGGRLAWRLSAYRSEDDDDIIALASAVQGRGYFANAPRTRRQGLEARLDYVAPRWSAYAAYGYVDATYRFSGALPSPNSPFADANGNVQVKPGDHIGGVPAQRFKAGVEGRIWRGLTLGADLLAVGRQYYVGDEANQDAMLAGYWTVGLHGEVRLAGSLALFARVGNLFGRRYSTYGAYFDTTALANLQPSPLPADADPHTVTPAEPRAFVLGLSARW